MDWVSTELILLIARSRDEEEKLVILERIPPLLEDPVSVFVNAWCPPL